MNPAFVPYGNIAAETNVTAVNFHTSTFSRVIDTAFRESGPNLSRELLQRVDRLLGPNTYQAYALDGKQLILTRPYGAQHRLEAGREICIHLVEAGAVNGHKINLLDSSVYASSDGKQASFGNVSELENALKEAEVVHAAGFHPVKNVLITGSTGTIGGELLLALKALGFNVIGVDKNPSKFHTEITEASIVGDLRLDSTYSTILERMPKIDLIMHLAAEPEVHASVVHPELARESMDIHLRVLEFAKKTGAAINFSSSREVYGHQPRTPITEDMADFNKAAESPYATVKQAGELLTRTYRSLYGLDGATFRYSNVYGPFENRGSRVMCLWTRKALKGENLTVFSGPEDDKVYSFTALPDAVRGTVEIARALRSPFVNQETFHICGPKGVSLKDAATLIQNIVHEIKGVTPGKLEIKANREGEINWFVGDNKKLNHAVGYTPLVAIEPGYRWAIPGYIEKVVEKGL